MMRHTSLARSLFSVFVILIVLSQQSYAHSAEDKKLGEMFLKAVGPADVQSDPSMTNSSKLTLDVVLDQVRNNHPKLYSADLERRIAGAKLLEKQGAFDPGISLETDYLRYNDFIQRGKVSRTFDNDLSINWLSRSGLKLSSGARYNTGDVKPPLYPTGDTGEYFMGLKMPLLRGFRINEKVVAEQQAQLGIPKADNAYTETRLLILLQAAYAYWDWAVADNKIAVGNNLLSQATFRYTAVKERVDAGDLPEIDSVEAEQEVKRREGFLNKLSRDYEKSVFKLSQYLWEPSGTPSPLPAKSSIPEQRNVPPVLTEDDWMEGRITAIEKRPESKALDIQKEMTEVDLKFAKNQRLPILDLFAVPGYDTGGSSIGATLKAGVAIVVPLRQRTARGLIAAAEFKIQKLDLEQRLILQRILLEVDDAYSAVKASWEQYNLAKSELELAAKLEEGERTRFEYGDSTLFLVNQRERSSAEASLKLLELEANYLQSIASFKAATGEI